MAINVEAVYEDGVLKLTGPLALKDHDKVTLSINPSGRCRGYGLIQWTGSLEDLDYLIEDVD